MDFTNFTTPSSPPDESNVPAKGKDYGSWALLDLKNELRRRNAKQTGKKAQLVQRLIDYDQLFGNVVNNPETSYKLNEPEAKCYLDITSDTIVPSLNEDDLNRFCALTEREDKKTAANMYKEGFLLTCRLAHEPQEDIYFINSICSAEMRKNISYKVIIKLTDHLILETQCECAAGMGPYAQCKHVIVVIYGIMDFTKTKNINKNKTCTSQLQTFHRPNKVYTGNPVKAEDLILKSHDQNLNNMTKFDPRPSKLKYYKYGIPPEENYPADFRNLIINFSASQKNCSMPIRNLYRPADKKTFYRDHDYLEKTVEEQFIQNNKLNKQQITKLELNTRNKKVWTKERQRRLQSSEFGRICKSKDATKPKLAKSLLKNKNITSPAICHGIKYEDKAIHSFSKKTGLEVQKCGLIVNENHQYLGCTPDGLVGVDAVLEVKCPYSAKFKNISPETIEYVYLCEETGELKLDEHHNYNYQVQGQMLCTERSLAYFCIYTITDFKVLCVRRNEAFIKTMQEKLFQFYNQYFVTEFCNKYLYNQRI